MCIFGPWRSLYHSSMSHSCVKPIAVNLCGTSLSASPSPNCGDARFRTCWRSALIDFNVPDNDRWIDNFQDQRPVFIGSRWVLFLEDAGPSKARTKWWQRNSSGRVPYRIVDRTQASTHYVFGGVGSFTSHNRPRLRLWGHSSPAGIFQIWCSGCSFSRSERRSQPKFTCQATN